MVSTIMLSLPWTRQDGQALIETKHKAGGVVLSDEDRNTLLTWLVSKFGPDTKPFPRTYIPPEITTFFSDPEARRLLARACTSCHQLDRVEKARYSKSGGESRCRPERTRRRS